MEIIAKKLSSETKKLQTLVIFTSRSPARGKAAAKVFTQGLDKALVSLLTDAEIEKSLNGSSGETVFFRSANIDGFKHVLSVGLGDRGNINGESIRNAMGSAYQALNANKVSSCVVDTASLNRHLGNSAEAMQAAAEGLALAAYDFSELKSKKEKSERLKTIHFGLDNRINLNSVKKVIDEALVMAECVNFSRRLGDTPGNLMTPKRLAEETQKAAQGTKLKVTIWDRARIKKEKMGGLYGVSLGSSAEPRFIIMEYKGAAASKKPVCFVGKGLTFDSGGISIKPAQGMEEMKYDMCGGANVIGTMLAIARLKLKINAIGFVPASENMPGPLANKPGDILVARNGKSVEVNNTDAEGRVILMDALSYASEKKPAAIFDAATLTGAIVIALGNVYTGVFSRDNKLVNRIQKAAQKSGEMVWPMPLHDHHVSDMKGTHADLSNISASRGAGSSTAAAFLEHFVDKDIPWAHFDIAGTAWNVGNRLNYCPKKGASGAMVRTFVELAKTF